MKGRGWHGERDRHRLAALRGKVRARKSADYLRGFKEGVVDSADEKKIALLTENLEYRIWDRMGEYGINSKDYRNVREFEREFDEWSGWEDSYDEIGGEVAHEFDLKPGPDDLAIEVLADIIHKNIYNSIMNMMDEMIKDRIKEQNDAASRVVRQQRVLRGGL